MRKLGFSLVIVPVSSATLIGLLRILGELELATWKHHLTQSPFQLFVPRSASVSVQTRGYLSLVLGVWMLHTGSFWLAQELTHFLAPVHPTVHMRGHTKKKSSCPTIMNSLWSHSWVRVLKGLHSDINNQLFKMGIAWGFILWILRARSSAGANWCCSLVFSRATLSYP